MLPNVEWEAGTSKDVPSTSANNSTRMKKTCENCTSVKVKCEGYPVCKRCSRKGLACTFREQHKRGRKRQLDGDRLGGNGDTEDSRKTSTPPAMSSGAGGSVNMQQTQQPMVDLPQMLPQQGPVTTMMFPSAGHQHIFVPMAPHPGMGTNMDHQSVISQQQPGAGNPNGHYQQVVQIAPQGAYQGITPYQGGWMVQVQPQLGQYQLVDQSKMSMQSQNIQQQPQHIQHIQQHVQPHSIQKQSQNIQQQVHMQRQMQHQVQLPYMMKPQELASQGGQFTPSFTPDQKKPSVLNHHSTPLVLAQNNNVTPDQKKPPALNHHSTPLVLAQNNNVKTTVPTASKTSNSVGVSKTRDLKGHRHEGVLKLMEIARSQRLVAQAFVDLMLSKKYFQAALTPEVATSERNKLVAYIAAIAKGKYSAGTEFSKHLNNWATTLGVPMKEGGSGLNKKLTTTFETRKIHRLYGTKHTDQDTTNWEDWRVGDTTVCQLLHSYLVPKGIADWKEGTKLKDLGKFLELGPLLKLSQCFKDLAQVGAATISEACPVYVDVNNRFISCFRVKVEESVEDRFLLEFGADVFGQIFSDADDLSTTVHLTRTKFNSSKHKLEKAIEAGPPKCDSNLIIHEYPSCTIVRCLWVEDESDSHSKLMPHSTLLKGIHRFKWVKRKGEYFVEAESLYLLEKLNLAKEQQESTLIDTGNDTEWLNDLMN
eukprot:CAMPEP_0203746534 /NCGR_PEP_ID=MMETSP0098-20131031/1949_1 /ASSEMBLY_ACC=CAM_ASM_000208 /TAXON_ID=96639 /ORGANISM=" , Strain NY0313808BC1" /LENGTH=703 /DNA_ID=CAMNT_0050634667 /DNA_START=417 /DNA_END=2525 /DNA_ORIENTATION=+